MIVERMRVMKKALIIYVSIALTLAIFGCGNSNKASDVAAVGASADMPTAQVGAPTLPMPDSLYFTSLEDFLNTHRLLSENGAGAEAETLPIADWWTVFPDRTLVDVIENVDLSSLEKLYLPIRIPEAYQLYNIEVDRENVAFWYLPEEYAVLEDGLSHARMNRSYFLFTFTRWDMESPMDAILGQHQNMPYFNYEEDMIAGKVFMRPNMFNWASESENLLLRLPIPPSLNIMDLTLTNDDIARHMGHNSIEELAVYTTVEVLDLRDATTVNAILARG